jgi:FHA domain-containing protein
MDGLGTPDLRIQSVTPEMMRLLGQLLRGATKGSIELLAARASLKREVRAEVTMIVAKANNPLKFSPSVEVALQYLLGPKVSGFMPPVESMRDAFDDLRAHQLGIMAGMEAALAGVLKRFDPAALESKLASRSALSSLIPSTRKAKLWELFQALYQQLATEAEDDFNALFGAAFLRAYEQYIDQIETSNSEG